MLRVYCKRSISNSWNVHQIFSLCNNQIWLLFYCKFCIIEKYKTILKPMLNDYKSLKAANYLEILWILYTTSERPGYLNVQ